jgi:hypothetical protein
VSEPTSPPGPDQPDPTSPAGAYPSYHPPGQGPTTPWQPAAPPPPGSTRQSPGARAFGLALLPLLVTNVISLVLAVLALVRPADGADPGRGFALLAIAVDVLVIAAWALGLALLLG